MTLAVAIKNLKKSYGQTAAVKDISFTVKAAEIFGLLGPNGAGKTTTIRCLCTLAKPDGGKIEVGGVDALNNPKSARSRQKNGDLFRRHQKTAGFSGGIIASAGSFSAG